jgi:hypothetical protein
MSIDLMKAETHSFQPLRDNPTAASEKFAENNDSLPAKKYIETLSGSTHFEFSRSRGRKGDAL